MIDFIFLTEDDLNTLMFSNYIDKDDQEDCDALEQIERQQIARIKTKLRQRFEVDDIFNTNGVDRNDEIVNCLTALVCYYMIRRNAARKIPDDYVKEKKQAEQWLKDVREGIETPSLPKVVTHNEVLHGNSRNDDYLV